MLSGEIALRNNHYYFDFICSASIKSSEYVNSLVKSVCSGLFSLENMALNLITFFILS